jgi:monoamine oxidase
LLEAEAEASAGESEVRCGDGNVLVVDSIARLLGLRVTVHLGHVVTRVQWKPGEAVVSATRGDTTITVRAPKVVVTIPLALLAAEPDGNGAIEFDPPLHQLREPLSTLEMGHAMRMSFVFRSAFWQSVEELPDLLFAQKFDEPVPTWWRADPHGTPVLIGWAAGPQARALDATRGDALRDVALDSLARVLGVDGNVVREHFVSWHFHDWSADPFSRGAYSYVGVGGTEAWKALRAPIDDTIFIAGEAAAGHGWNATMDGALESASGRISPASE